MQFGLYVMFMGVFHWLEFFMTALFNADTLSFDSFILNHSTAYHYAVAASLVEYWSDLRFLLFVPPLFLIYVVLFC